MSKKVKPLSPSEVTSKKRTIIPDEVISAINKLIAKNFSNGFASFTQKEAIEAIKDEFVNDVSTDTIFDNGWLDFEDIYRKEGWKVKYDKPGYNESYEPTFEFKVATAKYA
jgi:hypothetical protein